MRWCYISDITTSKVKVTVGSEFTASCTFTQTYNGPLNASFLYFAYPDKWTETIEHVVNGKAMLKIASMQTNDTGIYYCYLNETSIGGKEKAAMAFTWVSVDGKFIHSIVCNPQVCSEHFTLCSLTDLFNSTPSRLLWEVRII